MPTVLLLIGLLLLMGGAGFTIEGVRSIGFPVLVIGLVMFMAGGVQVRQERKVISAQAHADVLRLCDATGTGWYWQNNSQVACPRDWIKK